jgi:hypothetical protein
MLESLIFYSKSSELDVLFALNIDFFFAANLDFFYLTFFSRGLNDISLPIDYNGT